MINNKKELTNPKVQEIEKSEKTSDCDMSRYNDYTFIVHPDFEYDEKKTKEENEHDSLLALERLKRQIQRKAEKLRKK